MKIFISSSKKEKSKKAAQKLAAYVQREHQINAVRSTDPGVYPPGHSKFDSMTKTGIGLQGAITIISEEDDPDDKINQFIQYAVLVGSLSSWRSILCCYGNVEIASDMAGIKHIEWIIDEDATIEMEISEWIKELNNQDQKTKSIILNSDELSILKLMKRRKGSYGYTTYSYARAYGLDNIGEFFSIEKTLEILKGSNMIHEENIKGERVYFITDFGLENSSIGSKQNIKELDLIDDD